MRPLCGAAVYSLILISGLAKADGSLVGNFSNPTMIDMPNARMEADGTLWGEVEYFRNNQHYELGFQALPWLQVDLDYSGLSHLNPDYPVYWDRSLGVRAQLWDETDLRPAVAIGADDLIGTGIFSGEYLTASKEMGDFDTTLGMGWGQLGSTDLLKNPLILISRHFQTQRPFLPSGGTDFSVLFTGPYVGLFGGTVWHTPIDGLSLSIEYSSDKYPLESSTGNFTPRNQMNYGVSYQVSDATTLGLYWLYGAAIGGNLYFQLDPTKAQYAETIGEPLPPINVRSPKEQQNALQTLLNQRGGFNSENSASPALSRADKNAFVDFLLGHSEVSNVTIKGRIMTVFLNDVATDHFCKAIAKAVEYSGTELSSVILQSQRKESKVRCSVPRHVYLTPVYISTADPNPEIGRVPISATIRIDTSSHRESTNNSAAIQKFRFDAKRQQILISSVIFEQSDAIVYYSNNHFFSEADAVERLTRLLMEDAPTQIENFHLIAIQNGIPLQEFDLLRQSLERNSEQQPEHINVFDGPISLEAPPLYNPVLKASERSAYPGFGWDVYPQFRQQLFDPTNPLGLQLLMAADASVALAPGLSINGEAELNLVDTFTTARISDSLLPHVRSDFNKYFTQGKNGIGALDTEYRFRLASDLFGTLKAGYLESMFSGTGGEVLWRPEDQRWAIGADLYEVWQRGFDRLFNLQSYHQTTGHVSVYYASPFYDLDFELRAGQYLAGDVGYTFQLSRRFSTGVEIGAFFTRTNVSAAQFGEGSFDKGIIVRIPLNWVAPINSQSEIATVLRPVQRDGGQTILDDATLYDETRRTSKTEIYRTLYDN